MKETGPIMGLKGRRKRNSTQSLSSFSRSVNSEPSKGTLKKERKKAVERRKVGEEGKTKNIIKGIL